MIDGSTWLSVSRKILVPLILFFSATQLGLHFWPSSALVFGIRVDYLSPTLYLLDLLILLYLLTLNSYVLNLKSIIPLLPLLLTNLLFSLNPLATLTWSFHLILYLSFVLSLPPISLPKLTAPILSLTLLFQATLSFAQVILGRSLQGPLYYLGERMVSVGLPNVATASLFGSTLLRAYGTFSHPNVLAGWAVISLLILFRLKSNISLLTSAISLTIILVMLAQSRSAAIILFGLIVPTLLLRTWRPRLIYFVLLLTTSAYLLTTGVLSRAFDLSLSQRYDLQQVSLRVIQHFPLFGTGGNASISTYPVIAPNFRLLQPDHNSITLLISWFGLVGIVALFPLLQSHLWNLKSLLLLTPILLLDHYLVTSPQGLFVLLLYLKVVHSYHAQSRRQ